MIYFCSQELAYFFCKGPGNKIFTLVGHMASVITIQFCYYSTKVAIHIIYKQMNVAVFHKAVFTKTDSRPDFPKPCTNTFSFTIFDGSCTFLLCLQISNTSSSVPSLSYDPASCVIEKRRSKENFFRFHHNHLPSCI